MLDGELSGALCFLLLAVLMYVKFVRPDVDKSTLNRPTNNTKKRFYHKPVSAATICTNNTVISSTRRSAHPSYALNINSGKKYHNNRNLNQPPLVVTKQNSTISSNNEHVTSFHHYHHIPHHPTLTPIVQHPSAVQQNIKTPEVRRRTPSLSYEYSNTTTAAAENSSSLLNYNHTPLQQQQMSTNISCGKSTEYNQQHHLPPPPRGPDTHANCPIVTTPLKPPFPPPVQVDQHEQAMHSFNISTITPNEPEQTQQRLIIPAANIALPSASPSKKSSPVGTNKIPQDQDRNFKRSPSASPVERIRSKSHSFSRVDPEGPAQIQLEVARQARIPLFNKTPLHNYCASTVDTTISTVFESESTSIHQKGRGYPEEGIEYIEDEDEELGLLQVKTSVKEAQDRMHSTEVVQDDSIAENKVENENNNVLQSRKKDVLEERLNKRKKPMKQRYKNLHISYDELSLSELIGQGAFGTVHKATWRGTTVAVKVLACQQLTPEVLKEFEAEVEIMSILRHPNICLLMGACLNPPTRCLVIEYLPKGSLWSVLRQNNIEFNYDRRLSFAKDTVMGMNYLHTFNPPILHRDLKSPNLLIDNGFNVKLSDFGLSRVKAHFQTMTGNCGTIQWMAPEVLAAQKYTEKADVFSFGIVCWELITRKCPYEGLSQIQAALGVLNNDLRPPVPVKCPSLFTYMMTSCWASKPEDRPAFKEILQLINHSQNNRK